MNALISARATSARQHNNMKFRAAQMNVYRLNVTNTTSLTMRYVLLHGSDQPPNNLLILSSSKKAKLICATNNSLDAHPTVEFAKLRRHNIVPRWNLSSGRCLTLK